MLLVNSTIEDVATKEDYGYKGLEAVLERWINKKVD
jgi:hypothetical protein